MPSQTLKRADLYQALHEEAARRDVPTEHGKRLADAKQTGDAVRAVFADGSPATCSSAATACTQPSGGSSTRPRPARPTPG